MNNLEEFAKWFNEYGFGKEYSMTYSDTRVLIWDNIHKASFSGLDLFKILTHVNSIDGLYSFIYDGILNIESF